MRYPIYQIDAKTFGQEYEWLDGYIRYDDLYYNNDRKDKDWFIHFLGKRFVDCDGIVYRLEGRTSERKWYHWLFGIRRYHCIFSQTGEQLSLDEVREIFIAQFLAVGEVHNAHFLEDIVQAHSIEELLTLEWLEYERLFPDRC